MSDPEGTWLLGLRLRTLPKDVIVPDLRVVVFDKDSGECQGVFCGVLLNPDKVMRACLQQLFTMIDI